MKWYFPPRPESAIPPDLIKYYEDRGWWAQLKKNGTLQVITISVTGEVTFKTRHNEPNKAWKPIPQIISYFSSFEDSVFVAELLHSKHASIKNHLYIFDVLRYHGKDLIGMTLQDRLELLNKVVPLSEHISLTQWYKKDLYGLFRSLHDPIDEGIVLKDPNSRLKPCTKAKANANWQVKARVTHKNYGF